jgi:cullin 4
MADLVALLTFPSVSDGFSALRLAIRDSHTTLPSLPLSKVARLDADSDSGSASRSRAGVHPTPRSVVAGGPVRVSISGSLRECPHFVNYSRPPNTMIVAEQPYTEHQIDGSLAVLRRCMRIILTRDSTDTLPLTYERIYALCRDAVVIHRNGETLGDVLKKELDQSVSRLERGLADDISEGVGFALPFAHALTWFEKQLGLLEDVMTYLDRGYLAQTKEGDGMQFVP